MFKAIKLLFAICVFGCFFVGCGTEAKDKSIESAANVDSKITSEEVSEEKTVEVTNAQTDNERNIVAELMVRKETDVCNLYEEQILIQEAVRTLVAERMSSTSFVQVEPREKYDYTEILIDEVSGNPIVSEGVKAMLDAVSEEKRVDEILAATAQGVSSGISDYLQGEAEGMITDVIGVDIFSAADFINAWQNVDNTPVVLMQNIVNNMKTDVGLLDVFLRTETMNSADIYQIAQIVYRIHISEEQIAQIAEGEACDSTSDYLKLRELAEKYAAIEGKLQIYSNLEFPKQISELHQDEYEEFQADLEALDSLFNLPTGNFAIDYDVKGYQKAQEAVEQTGLLANSFLGDLLGGFAADDTQMVEDWIQQERSRLYEELSGYLLDSYKKVIAVQVMMDRYLAKLQWLSDAAGDELYMVQLYVDAFPVEEEKQSLLEQMVAALEMYEFDLTVACSLYECVLSECRTDMLDALLAERERVTLCIDNSGIMRGNGYSVEEMSERYNALMDQYVDMVDYVQIRGGANGGKTPGFSDLGGFNNYKSGKYHAYGNQGKVTLIVMMLNGQYLHDENTIRFYYDCHGNLLCYKHPQNRVYCWNGQILYNEFGDDESIKDELESATVIYEQFISE